MSTYQNSLIYISISLKIPVSTYTTSSSVICFIPSLSLPLISSSHCALVPCPHLLLILSLGVHMTSYLAGIGGWERERGKENQWCPPKCTLSSRGRVLTCRLFISIIVFVFLNSYCFTIEERWVNKKSLCPWQGDVQWNCRELLFRSGNANNSIFENFTMNQVLTNSTLLGLSHSVCLLSGNGRTVF